MWNITDVQVLNRVWTDRHMQLGSMFAKMGSHEGGFCCFGDEP
jgi:hypothetical protein